jgi:hypothetical protein
MIRALGKSRVYVLHYQLQKTRYTSFGNETG